MGIDIYGNDTLRSNNKIMNTKINKNDIIEIITDDSSAFEDIINNIIKQKYYTKTESNKTFYKQDYINKNFLTKDKTYDKDYIDNYVRDFKDQLLNKFSYVEQNYIKKDVIAYSNTYMSLGGKRRIAAIKPGIDGSDAVNKKQMEDYCYDKPTIDDKLKDLTKGELHKLTNAITRGKRGVDKIYFPYLSGNDVDFENKVIMNVANGINDSDAINKKQLEEAIDDKIKNFVGGNRNVILICGELKLINNINPHFIINGERYFPVLRDGTIEDIETNLEKDEYTVSIAHIKIDHTTPFNVIKGNLLYFKPKPGLGFKEGYKFYAYLFIKFDY